MDLEVGLEEKDFFERLQENPRPVVIDFWASWCSPCHMIEPIIRQLSQEYKGRVDLWKINADDHPEIMRHYRVNAIPTLIGIHAGREITRQTGAATPDVFHGLFESALSGEKPATPPLSAFDRVMRVAIGLALLLLAFSGGFSGLYLIAVGLSLVALFSAFADLIPPWQTIVTRFNKKK